MAFNIAVAQVAVFIGQDYEVYQAHEVKFTDVTTKFVFWRILYLIQNSPKYSNRSMP